MSVKQRIALFFGILEACLLPGLFFVSFGLGLRLELPFWIVGAVVSGFGAQNIAGALRRPEPPEVDAASPVLSENEIVATRLTYSRLATERLRELLVPSANLRPGAAELVREELQKRGEKLE